MQDTRGQSSRDTACFRTRGLTKVYGSGASAVHALRGVDLEIPEGDLVVLLVFLAVLVPV